MKPGLYIIEFPTLVGGGKSKGLGIGKEIKGGKKRKKGKLTVPIHKTQLVKHDLTLFLLKP